MSRWVSRFILLSLVLLPLLFSGCVGLIAGKPPGPWYTAYEPITDPAVETFVFQALEKAKVEFGEPTVPVNQVIFRRSRKTEAAENYRIGEHFSMTECIDPTNGVFVIYIGVDADHKNFYPLLAHECAHLINAKITDWYMEGLATVFSEAICEEAGKEWGNWKRHFMRSRVDPYGLSYRMMNDLQSAFPQHYPTLLQFAVSNGKGAEWMQIDIDAWLATLPAGGVDDALEIIEPHVKVLRRRVNEQYRFAVPEALQ
ncbi:MAG: hypothetical protein V5783_07670 [Pontiella sp.]